MSEVDTTRIINTSLNKFVDTFKENVKNTYDYFKSILLEAFDVTSSVIEPPNFKDIYKDIYIDMVDKMFKELKRIDMAVSIEINRNIGRFRELLLEVNKAIDEFNEELFRKRHPGYLRLPKMSVEAINRYVYDTPLTHLEVVLSKYKERLIPPCNLRLECISDNVLGLMAPCICYLFFTGTTTLTEFVKECDLLVSRLSALLRKTVMKYIIDYSNAIIEVKDFCIQVKSDTKFEDMFVSVKSLMGIYMLLKYNILI